MPTGFCGVEVRKQNLAPLLPPEGAKVVNELVNFQAVQGAGCRILVDGKQALYVSVSHFRNKVPTPVMPDPARGLVVPPFKHGADRAVSFGGEAYLGSDGGIIRATCDAPNSYVEVIVRLGRGQILDTSEGYEKMQPFVEEFVPKEAKKYDCTK
ncbi:hypothetical protein ACGFW5_24240 [Streptomyces sp. NPDC048416]|uniref:hypothetical protein n=1 Tax=Streptomyces sp. NPDC048416 TaxID=3365546 RepID=UPI0037200795